LTFFQTKSVVGSGSGGAATVSQLKTAESFVELASNGIINPNEEGCPNRSGQSQDKVPNGDVIKNRPLGVLKVEVENTDSLSTVQSALSDNEVQLVGKR
jgi:hypothetical protein